MSDIKHIDIKEFRELGFLQEANRWFFHRLGLALEVVQEEDGTEHLGGIWDYRDDPEGVVFTCDIDAEKIERVSEEAHRHRAARIALMGQVIQHSAVVLPEAEWPGPLTPELEEATRPVGHERCFPEETT